MTYQFEFQPVLESWRELANGAFTTLWLSVVAMAIGLVVAVFGALMRASGPLPVRVVIKIYIEIIRNTPFPVQLFLIYFGLPAIGIRLSSNTASLLALVVNVGAYGIEILRAGIESIGKGQIEAGASLGLRPLQVFRHVVFKPALQAVYPALTSQFILLMLYSSVCSAIAASELTGVAGDIQSHTFRSFEVYALVTCIYLGMSVVLWIIFGAVERRYIRIPSR